MPRPDKVAVVDEVKEKFSGAPVGTLLGRSVEERLDHAMKVLTGAGAEVLVGGTRGGGKG